MSLNITAGLKLDSKKEVKSEQVAQDFLEDDFENHIDLQESIENLIIIRDALAKVNYSNDAISVLKSDPIFKQIVESNSDPKIAIDETIKTAQENFMQEFISFGPVGPLVALISAFFGSIKRTTEMIYKTKSHEVVVPTHRFYDVTFQGNMALYLPKYDEAIRVFKGLAILRTGIEKLVKDPNSDIKGVIAGYQALGFKIDEKNVVDNYYKIDWKAALAGNAVMWPMFALITIFPSLAPLIGFSSALAAVKAIDKTAKNKGTLPDKGYTPEKFRDCCKQYYDLAESVPALKKLKPAKVIKDTEDVEGKVRFVKTALKVYLGTLKTFGKGLQAAIGITH